MSGTDPAALAAFRRYWLLIRPFSGVVRRVWLRGVGARPSGSGMTATADAS